MVGGDSVSERQFVTRAGELREAFVDWQILKGADHVISCAQDGTVHGHAVEEIVAARPVGPAPWPSEP